MLGEIICGKSNMGQDHRNRLSLALGVCIGTLSILPVQAVYISIFPPRVSAQQIALQRSPEQIKQLAQSITVKIVSGDNGGSGILIKKEGQVYTVLTNRHVLDPGKLPRIQTPDGKAHQANLVKNVNFQGKDLALLQFSTNAKYAVASLGNLSTVAVNDQVFAAGFPFEANQSQAKGLVLKPGQVLYVPKQAFKEGYQIGYSNEVEKGMSGGPILNSQGKVIGINGIHAYPLWGNPYVYEDNSQPTPADRDLMSRYSWGIPIQTLARLAPQYASSDALPVANSPSTQTLPAIANDVNNTAQEITVRIDVPNASHCSGSGVIIAKQGNTYTVLTAEHVVREEKNCDRTTLEIVTPDGQRYQVTNSTVKPVQEADLAVLQFTSNQNYRVATLAKYDLVRGKGFVFIPGWAEARSGVGEQRRLFTAGEIGDRQFGSVLEKNSLSLTYGYGLAYTNLTEPGMSGGPVLDIRGRVIGIHGQADEEEIKDEAGHKRLLTLGLSLGVPVSAFLSQAQVIGIRPEWLRVETSSPPPLTDEERTSISKAVLRIEKPSESSDAIDWLNYGWQIGRLGVDKEQAIKAIDRAIQFKPNFYQAWYLRSFMLVGKNKYQEALKSLDKATQIEPGFAPAWRWRGIVLSNLSRLQEALGSFDQAIKLDPKDLSSQIFRSIMLTRLQRFPEALDAANQVLKSNPSSWAYFARGKVLMEQKDFKGALADLNEAIRRNPEYIERFAYYLRGALRAQQKDFKGALADLNEAVSFDPKNADYTRSRGYIRFKLEDYKGAIADYNAAIRLQPDYADAYYNRGLARTELKDYKGAIEDYTQVLRPQEVSGVGIQLQVNPQTKVLTVEKVIENSPSQKGGVKVGDQVLAIDSQPTTNMSLEQAIKLIRGQTGTPLSLRISRAGTSTFNIALTRAPLAIDPKFTEIYYKRGLARAQLKDNQGARQDFQTAADLYKQQGKTGDYQEALARIKELQQ